MITGTERLPALLIGMEKWMELLFLGPASARDELLAKCHDFFVKEVLAYRKAGANALIYSNPFGSTDIVPMAFFMEQALPWIEKDIQAVGTQGVVYCCGMAPFRPVIDLVLQRTGLGAYYLSPFDDIRQSKEIIAGRGLACGVINDIQLIDCSAEEVTLEVKTIIEAGMPGGKFLFGTGLMPHGIPEKNIRAMLEAACQFGSYEKRKSRA
jgi:uroporphyrinogen decarboxylase